MGKNELKNNKVKRILFLMIFIVILAILPYFGIGGSYVLLPIIFCMPLLVGIFIFLGWRLYIEINQPKKGSLSKTLSIVFLVFMLCWTVFLSPLILQMGLYSTNGFQRQI